MKNFSDFIATAALVILFGYISFSEMRQPPRSSTISDEAVADVEYVTQDRPFPAISLDVPMEVSFAGEPVPMDIPDVYERLDKELQSNTYFHSNTIFLIKRAGRWLPQIEEILKENGVPDDFKYLPLIESNLLNVISPRDAVGYWQILKGSGRELGLEITNEVDERYDPLKATEAACKYLKKAHEKFGNWTLAAASYNRGMNGLARAIENQRVTSYYDLYLNDETSRYVFRILAIKEIIGNPLKYGFRISPEHIYKEEPLKYIEVTESIKDIVTFARQHDTNYKIIKLYNPWLRDDKLTVRKGKHYQIALPQ